MNEPIYLRPTDVQRLFGIPENTQKVLRWRAMRGLDTNPIPNIKRGKSVFYCRLELIRWFESQTVFATRQDQP